MEDTILDSWCNLGLILKLKYKDVAPLIRELKKQGIIVVYDRVSLKFLKVIELGEISGSRHGVEPDEQQ